MARDELELLEMGNRIKELRESHGFKQQWIADQVGVELRTYQFWQAGKSKPEQESLQKLAKLFGVTPKFILHGMTPDLLVDHGSQLDRIERLLKQVVKKQAEGWAILEGLQNLEERLAHLEREELIREREESQRIAEADRRDEESPPQQQ